MSSLWTDMLFLHGYISDLELARRWANAPVQPPPPETETCQRTFSLRALLGIGDGKVHTQ